MRAFPRIAVLAAAVLIAASSCGIEDYVFLGQVPESGIAVSRDDQARISVSQYTLPQSTYFTQFAIYYRIYLSGYLSSGSAISSAEFGLINPYLANDHAALSAYTDPTGTGAVTNVAAQFSSRNYYALSGIASLLGNPGAGGAVITLDFMPVPGQEQPVASRDGSAKIVLLRSTGSGAFTLQPPDRYFVVSTDLLWTMPSSTVNRDVAPLSSGAATHAYVSLYIVATGINDLDLSPIYSRPTFVGIFRLP